MSTEAKLIGAAVRIRDLSPLFERGVSDSWFSNDDDKRVWTFMRTHFAKYGECPSEEVVTSNFPTYRIAELTDSIDFLLDDLVDRRRKLSISNTLRSAVDAIQNDKDHESALLVMQNGIVKLEEDGLNQTSDVNLIETTESRWDDYIFRKNNPGLLGVATGFPTIDAVTNGLQKGQLIVVVATPKTGKSTLALQIANNIHKQGLSPMFQSFEMTNREQQDRYDSMRATISHNRLITGQLTTDEEKRYKETLEKMSEDEADFWLVDSAHGITTSAIHSKVQTLNPDVIFIDGVYLMLDESTGESNTPQALTGITRSLKRLAQKTNKPVIITTQALNWKSKKGKVTTDSIGYSSSFLQDADVVFGLEREDENVDDTRTLKVMASRQSGNVEASLMWDWSTGLFREMSSDDV
ncbi:DnaB Replicative DNA helicase [uncultured Caudovirales phage]|uniref:DnaB Replicative DNA helicase n=1 Tax=uncultured Caudovirales phage TaxID=2100421 RepID=A0A6J5L668_9CAUD|nr:DnaB Replicative DNA helicase [uncultured Caudovirales phage]